MKLHTKHSSLRSLKSRVKERLKASQEKVVKGVHEARIKERKAIIREYELSKKELDKFADYDSPQYYHCIYDDRFAITVGGQIEFLKEKIKRLKKESKLKHTWIRRPKRSL